MDTAMLVGAGMIGAGIALVGAGSGWPPLVTLAVLAGAGLTLMLSLAVWLEL